MTYSQRHGKFTSISVEPCCTRDRKTHRLQIPGFTEPLCRATAIFERLSCLARVEFMRCQTGIRVTYGVGLPQFFCHIRT